MSMGPTTICSEGPAEEGPSGGMRQQGRWFARAILARTATCVRPTSGTSLIAEIVPSCVGTQPHSSAHHSVNSIPASLAVRWISKFSSRRRCST